MKEAARKAIIPAVILFSGVTIATVVLWRGAKAEAVPQIVELRSNYEPPKNLAISNALDRCLGGLSKAQDELRALYDEGKVKRFLGIQGMWQAYVKSTNAEYSMVFESKTGPLLGFFKFVYTDKERKHELPELGYRVDCYKDGKVEHYARRTLRDGLRFYPDGGIETFYADIDDKTSCEASWAPDGKLKGEGLSSHPSRNQTGLSEWEKALRDGDFQTKLEAAAAMGDIGPASIPYALNVLKDGNEQSREVAASVFGFLREKEAPAVPDLVGLLRKEKSAVVRRNIARSLGMCPSAEVAIPALEEAATNDVPEVASAAKIALERIRGPASK
jgi:hypothetical protein